MSASVASLPAAVPIKGGRFLIVGGASLVGSASAELLLDAGAAEVVVLDNLSQGSLAALKHLEDNPRLKIVPGDVMRLPQLIAAMRDIDGVLHLAALMSLSMDRDPWTGLDVNIRGTQNVIEACCISGTKIGDGSEVKHFVHVSDVARANAAAFAAPATDIAVNISGPRPTTTLEIVRLVTELAGKRLEPEHVDPEPGSVRLTSGGDWSLEHGLAQRVLGWQPQIDMREGIRRLIAWREAAAS